MMQVHKCQSSGLGHKPVVALPYVSPEQGTFQQPAEGSC